MAADSARSMDQFFTKKETARLCVDLFEQNVAPLSSFDTIVEPSAGEGSFFDLLPADSRVGVDLDPKREDLIEANFLQLDFSEMTLQTLNGKQVSVSRDPSNVLVIGNPPFGRAGFLAARFLNHALSFANTVAFILPLIFRNENFIARINRRAHLVHEWQLAEDSFTFIGKQKKVKTVFQVWQLRDGPLRELTELIETHPDFEIETGGNYKGEDGPNIIVMWKSGYKSGELLPALPEKRNNVYVIIPKHTPGLIRDRLLSLKLHQDPSRSWNTGPFSISKHIIFKRYMAMFPDRVKRGRESTDYDDDDQSDQKSQRIAAAMLLKRFNQDIEAAAQMLARMKF